MKHIIILLFFLNTNFELAFSKEVQPNKSEPKVVKSENIKKIKVHGMACPLCQSKAEKKFREISSVKSVHVDMEKMLISLNLKEGADISKDKILPVIESLGLTFVKVID